MSRVASGKLDRRIQVQVTPEFTDAAGDVVKKPWEDAFRLWARLKVKGQGMEIATAAGVLRQFDVIFQVRDGTKGRSIGPETYRVLWHRRIYEIVSITVDAERFDLLNLYCCARPDVRGSRGLEGQSGEA